VEQKNKDEGVMVLLVLFVGFFVFLFLFLSGVDDDNVPTTKSGAFESSSYSEKRSEW
jgi:hypothetical protein